MFKKSIAIVIVILFLFCNISFTTLSDENKGNLSGKTLYVGGSGPGNYTKIQDAIDNASDGDTVFVFSGIYNESLFLNKSINLMGENRDNTIIDGKSQSPVIVIRVDNCSVSNLNTRYGKYDDIYIDSSNNIIRDNIIEESLWNGIGIGSGSNNIVTNNLIKGCIGYGVCLESTANRVFENVIKNNGKDAVSIVNSDNIVYNNKFSNDGIYNYNAYPTDIFNNTINGKKLVYLENEKNKILEKDAGQVILINCENITVKDNEIEQTVIGIYSINCNKISIVNNSINDIPIEFNRGIYIRHGKDISIIGNKVSNNSHIALLIDYSDKIFIEGNNFSNSYDGIYVGSGCSNIEICRNIISTNIRSGIMLNSNYNQIYENYIVNLKPLSKYRSPYGINVNGKFNDISKNNINGNNEGIHLFTAAFFNTIKQNNIYGNNIDATFIGGNFNRWQNNYWGENIFPKLIVGLKFLIYPVFTIPWINFDWLPAQEPYDIPVPEV